MTRGAVEERTAAEPASERLTFARIMGTRPLLAWGLALGLLALAFASVVVALNATVFSASGFVAAYLQSLERHDLASIMAMPGVEADDAASDALLRREALGALSQVEFIDDADHGGGEHHVTVAYRLAGEPGRTTFVVQHAGPHLGVFSAWRFVESPIATVSVVPQHTVEFEVNGVPVIATEGAGVGNPLQVLVPGAYTFDHESLYLEAEQATLPITSTHRIEEFELTVQASAEFEQAVEDELAAVLDRCTEQQVLQPTACPFGRHIADRIVSPPRWKIADYPTIEMRPGEQLGTWSVPGAHGVAHLEVEVMSLFDGTVSTLRDDVPFSVSYLVTFTAGGGLTLTPRPA